MYRILRSFLPAVAVVLLLSSCHSLPEHTRFIPKDALVVVGLHTGEMSKELAWSAITGSNLLDEMRKAGGDKMPDMLKDAQNAGIDFGSTMYFYSKPDTRFSGRTRMAAILPVADVKKLDAYIRKHAVGATIRTLNDRSEVLIDGKAYIGWNKDALIAMNCIVHETEKHETPVPDTVAGKLREGNDQISMVESVDSAATATEMDAAFHLTKDASIAGNSRFKDLENAGHDITLWVAQDALMDTYGSQGGLMGITMGNGMWKGGAMATGFDFEKGRVDGTMRYYTSDSMRSIAQEFGKENIDGEMLRRLPASGLNMALGYHLSPKAIKMMLDKMGVTGMANLTLMQKGMNIDDILGAFSGDMVVSINNFRVETKMQEIDSVTQKEFGLTPQPITSPGMDFVYAMKIGDKAKLTKLMSFLTSSELLRQSAPNVYTLPEASNGPTLMIGDKYLAVSSPAAGAQAFLKEPSGAMPDAVKKEINGHPVGMWADVQSFMTGAAQMSGSSASDSATFNAVRSMFTTFTINGGEFKGNASEYHMSLGFVNKDENSLVQLLHLAQQLAVINEKQVVAQR